MKFAFVLKCKKEKIIIYYILLSKRNLFLIPKEDIYKTYRSYCQDKNLPFACKINTVRNLNHLGIKVDAHLGSPGSHKRCFSGFKWWSVPG